MEMFILRYGYAALLLGSTVAAEIPLIIAGFLVSQGYLAFWPSVIVCAFGSFVGESAYFFIGRYGDRTKLAVFLKNKKFIGKISVVVNNHSNLLAFGFRYLIGFRIATLLMLGLSSISISRFFFWNSLSAAIWAPLWVGGGYVFGKALEDVVGGVNQIRLLLIVVVVAGAVWGFGNFLVRKRSKGKTDPP